MNNEIVVIESELNAALLSRDSGLADNMIHDRIVNLRKRLDLKKKDLKRKQIKARLERKYRANRKTVLKKMIDEDPKLTAALKV